MTRLRVPVPRRSPSSRPPAASVPATSSFLSLRGLIREGGLIVHDEPVPHEVEAVAPVAQRRRHQVGDLLLGELRHVVLGVPRVGAVGDAEAEAAVRLVAYRDACAGLERHVGSREDVRGSLATISGMTADTLSFHLRLRETIKTTARLLSRRQ